MSAPTTPITPEIKAHIEATWRARAAINFPNSKSALYQDRECEFYVGAMAALAAVQIDPPPIWIINIMSGRPVGEEKKHDPLHPTHHPAQPYG